jgi:hypothetical protein
VTQKNGPWNGSGSAAAQVHGRLTTGHGIEHDARIAYRRSMRTHPFVFLAFLAIAAPLAAGCGSDADSQQGTGSGASSGVGAGGNGAGSSGSGGNGPACTPEGPFDGKSVDAKAGEWTWVPVAGAVCRDGSGTGFGLRRSSTGSDKLMIYLEGGGACFNGTTCAINPSSFNETSFGAWKGAMGNAGIFDSTKTTNPVGDWNMVYVPFCTGDVHAGNAVDVDVPNTLTKNQDFVGYANLYLYLKRIIPTFPSMSKVLLTGISAGGFGAAYNYDRVAQAFCPTPVVLIDDSGPPMADEWLAPCLQKRWRGLWNIKDTLPADCADCTGADSGGIVHDVDYIGKKYGSGRLALISSNHDSVISTFFGFGQNDCKNLDGLASPMPADQYAAGLADLRDNHMQGPQWATYFIASTNHTWLLTGLYDTTVNGVKMVDWVNDVVNDGPMKHVGP